jgi:O-antigen/teichoic acid export membrane protein
MAQTLSDKADPLIISHFLGPTGVALYQPASKAALSLNPIVMTLTGQLYPLTTAFHTSGNKKSMNRMLFDGTRYTLLLGILFSAGIFIFAEPFARLWLAGSLGDAYKTVAHLMKLFAIIELFSYASGTQWPILLGMKKLTFLTNLHIITAVLNITLSIYFVGFTSIGIYGVLYGTLISKIIRTFFLYGYMSNIMKFHPLTFISQTLARPVLCLILTGFAGFILKENFSCQTWGDFVYLAGFTTLAWVGSCLVFGVSEGERVMLCNAGKGMYCKVRGKI